MKLRYVKKDEFNCLFTPAQLKELITNYLTTDGSNMVVTTQYYLAKLHKLPLKVYLADITNLASCVDLGNTYLVLIEGGWYSTDNLTDLFDDEELNDILAYNYNHLDELTPCLKDQLVNVLKPALHLSGTLSEENIEQFKMLAINLDIRIDDDEVITD